MSFSHGMHSMVGSKAMLVGGGISTEVSINSIGVTPRSASCFDVDDVSSGPAAYSPYVPVGYLIQLEGVAEEASCVTGLGGAASREAEARKLLAVKKMTTFPESALTPADRLAVRVLMGEESAAWLLCLEIIACGDVTPPGAPSGAGG